MRGIAPGLTLRAGGGLLKSIPVARGVRVPAGTPAFPGRNADVRVGNSPGLRESSSAVYPLLGRVVALWCAGCVVG